MSKYKKSFYNIDLAKAGYVEKMEGVTPVYNTLRGKFGYIPKDIDLDNPPEQLLKEGFIVPSDLDEPMQYVMAQKKAIVEEKPSEIHLLIATSLKCNFVCDYCFEKCHHGADMTDETMNDIIKYIQNEIDRNENLKKLYIRWFGGEPLLRMDVICTISEFVIPYCDARNIQYTAAITTNGYLFIKEISEELKDLRVSSAQIALDGFENTFFSLRKAPIDAYNKILQNIENSVIPVTIRLNTTKQNQDEIIELAKHLSKLKSVEEKRNNINIIRVREFGTNLKYGFTYSEWLKYRERIPELIEDLGVGLCKHIDNAKLYFCANMQKRNVVLCSDGYIYRCDYHLGNTMKAIGIIKNGLIENNEIDKKYIACLIEKDENCRMCKYLPICSLGCRYEYIRRNMKPCTLMKGKFRQNMTNYLKYVNPLKDLAPT